METPPNLPDDASMSDLTTPPSPHTLDAGDPALVGAETESDAADAPVQHDDPSLVGAPTDTDATESEDAPGPSAREDERAAQPLQRGYGGDTGYVQQPASRTFDPNEPGPGSERAGDRS